MWFVKKVTVFKRKDKETWQKIRDLLKSEGLKGVRASHYPIDSLNACGCGAKVDPRNFGAKGYIDRDVYFVDVKEEDLQRAKEIISSHGLEAVVEDDVIGKLGRM
ncbi:MAG: hypothetical protein IJU48_11315 [Synergistaceae bacterium]|nr:hypothetical protein [Synergistaceae bacterium]